MKVTRCGKSRGLHHNKMHFPSEVTKIALLATTSQLDPQSYSSNANPIAKQLQTRTHTMDDI